MPTAGRRRGELMGLGRVLALDSGLARWCSLSVGGVPPGAAPDFLFCEFAGGAGRWPLAELRGHRRLLAAAAAS